MNREHDFDAAWKSILDAFEKEIVELLFPEIYKKIDWNKETESLEQELSEIQKDIFDKKSSNKLITDKIIKVKLKDNESKILFIHIEVQSYKSENNYFGQRMFRYFYRLYDKFRYKEKDQSDIIAAAIYTYKGSRGKDTKYIYKMYNTDYDILTYNFHTIDVETMNLDAINSKNPLKLVFKIAKELLQTKHNSQDVFNAKLKLADELSEYKNIKNEEQLRALVDFLEYLFLIDDKDLEEKFKKIEKEKGGKFIMTIEQIREIYYTEKTKTEIAKNLLDILDDKTIAEKTGLTVEEVAKLRKN